MIEICKALSLKNKIIVMDEPTSALTKPEVKKLFAIIENLKKKGCGIIYITHKMEEIYKIADSITVLRDGKYVTTQSPQNLPEKKLIHAMVGRQINQQFPKHTASPGKAALKVKNFSVKHPQKGRLPLVDNVEFEVKAGEVLGIAGLQGSGNSELLNGIFGTFGKNQVSGEVTIYDKKINSFTPQESIKNNIALLTNDRKMTGLVLSMDIVENTTMASLKSFSNRFTWLKKSQESKQANVRANELNLKAQKLRMPVASLSGGNQQKVAIAKWIQTKPSVLLLDEPTRGIDIGAKHDIYQLINKWTSQGIAIVIITSEMPELLAVSDRIIVMHQGKINAQYTCGQASQEMILNAALGLIPAKGEKTN
jgi:ABC-type sugar transport system ATPase subunit